VKSRTVAQLTAGEIKAIADGLRGGMGNVYGVIAHEPYCIPKTTDDAIFERLEKEVGLCRCMECSMWRDKDDMDPHTEGICSECVDEMDGNSLGMGDDN
jgi:hypothetical protein